MKKWFIDKNQTILDFDLINVELKRKKEKIRKQHKEMNTDFHFKQTSLNSLVKLTYDITDKDFEYLYAYIMKLQWFEKFQVIWGYWDQGIDIRGLKDGIWYFIQCKQWSELYINPKQAWEFIWVVHHYQKKHPKWKFIYVTTSYPNENTRELLNDNQIKIIDNKELVEICESLGILSDEWWESMIKEVQLMRLQDIRKQDPQSGFQELKKIRINEALNHIPDYKNRTINILFSNEKYPFFQHWN